MYPSNPGHLTAAPVPLSARCSGKIARPSELRARRAEKITRSAELETRDAEQKARNTDLDNSATEKLARTVELRARRVEQKARRPEQKARNAELDHSARRENNLDGRVPGSMRQAKSSVGCAYFLAPRTRLPMRATGSIDPLPYPITTTFHFVLGRIVIPGFVRRRPLAFKALRPRPEVSAPGTATRRPERVPERAASGARLGRGAPPAAACVGLPTT
jgi:hypothetical protein